MGYVLTDKTQDGKRIRSVDGNLTPYFSSPDSALWYVRKHFKNSPYIIIHQV